MLIARVFRPAGAEDSGDRNPALTRWATFCRAYGARHVSTICDSFTPSKAGACATAQVGPFAKLRDHRNASFRINNPTAPVKPKTVLYSRLAKYWENEKNGRTPRM